MSFWTLDSFRRITHGRLLHSPARENSQHATRNPELSTLSTDTRTLGPTDAFLALRGERFDGHDFLPQAVDLGSPLLIVDRSEAAKGLPPGHDASILLVEDTYAALRRLAGAYRKTLRGVVIAVTGSVGKTTTKNLIHTILGEHYTGRASPKSFNNHIGVPLTLLSARPEDDYVVVEVGTNAPGEIAALSELVAAHVGVITAIGESHLAGLGSREAVAREKASLLEHMTSEALAVVNEDAPLLYSYLPISLRRMTFGVGADANLRLTRVAQTVEGVDVEINHAFHFHLPMPGVHNAHNAAAALAVARHMGLSDERIAAALGRAAPAAMRMEPRHLGSPAAPLTLLNDAYNANPTSMAAALHTLEQYPAWCASARRVAILGDMLELGEEAGEYHRRLGEQLAQSAVDQVILIGELMGEAAGILSRYGSPSHLHIGPLLTDDLAEQVVSLLQPHDLVLIKASRAAGLERVLPPIERRFAGHVHNADPSYGGHSSPPATWNAGRG